VTNKVYKLMLLISFFREPLTSHGTTLREVERL